MLLEEREMERDQAATKLHEKRRYYEIHEDNKAAEITYLEALVAYEKAEHEVTKRKLQIALHALKASKKTAGIKT